MATDPRLSRLDSCRIAIANRHGIEATLFAKPDVPVESGAVDELVAMLELAEAVVLESYEGMSNHNEAERDAFGRTKRSLSKAGMVGRGELGGFVVRVVETGVEFRLGYNHVLGGVDRVSLWERREELVGRLVKFRHQPSGAKDAPRFPKFVGWREAWDL